VKGSKVVEDVCKSEGGSEDKQEGGVEGIFSVHLSSRPNVGRKERTQGEKKKKKGLKRESPREQPKKAGKRPDNRERKEALNLEVPTGLQNFTHTLSSPGEKEERSCQGKRKTSGVVLGTRRLNHGSVEKAAVPEKPLNTHSNRRVPGERARRSLE